MALIRNQQLDRDNWLHLEDTDTPESGAFSTVTLGRLTSDVDALASATEALGVRVPGETDEATLLPFLDRLGLICIEFPKFTDGRGYSLARLLRERHGYKGELRATGDVLHDQLFFLSRCGFDAFELKDGKDAEKALSAFSDFTVRYQGAADESQPLWRRTQ